MEIRHYNNMTRTPALALAVEGWMWLVKKGHTDGGFVLNWEQKAILALRENAVPVGVLTWSDQPWNASVFVNLAYVKLAFRRTGVHTAMFDALVERARELGRPTILSGAMKTNNVSRHAMKAQGRVEYAVMTKFDVPPA